MARRRDVRKLLPRAGWRRRTRLLFRIGLLGLALLLVLGTLVAHCRAPPFMQSRPIIASVPLACDGCPPNHMIMYNRSRPTTAVPDIQGGMCAPLRLSVRSLRPPF